MADELLKKRRDRVLSPSYSHFYEPPIHIVKGEGVWLWDAEGTKYLDCYNNVASVGHCHPRVVEVLCDQARTLNTHTRYLHENIVRLGEALAEKLPGDLGRCIFVCTGTEANDLAVQIARAATGHHGIMVSENSYHGNSTLVRQLSVCEHRDRSADPDWLCVIAPPNTYRGPYRTGEPNLGSKYKKFAAEGIDALESRGHQLSAFLVDTIWDDDGVIIAPGDYLAKTADLVRRHGGLVIADEVQAGYCRTGTNWWGFENYGIVPDIVTMGKPMGNGHPLAAVVTTPEIADAFAAKQSYFNTFGGNPVATAVGLSVLNVIDEENLLDHVKAVGTDLGRRLGRLAERHDIIGNIQGTGLFWGLDLVVDRETRNPLSRAQLRTITTELAGKGVLTGIAGRHGNVLKIRPPLVFDNANADQLITALDEVLLQLGN